MRKLAVFLTICGFLILSSAIAFAQEIHSPHIGTNSECPAVWHFVHNQIEENTNEGVLTVEFQNTGSVTVHTNKILRKVQHYDITLNGPDTLLEASDNIAGGKLLLSNVTCIESPPTTTTTVPPTTTTTTTTTTVPITTTTTVPIKILPITGGSVPNIMPILIAGVSMMAIGLSLLAYSRKRYFN